MRALLGPLWKQSSEVQIIQIGKNRSGLDRFPTTAEDCRVSSAGSRAEPKLAPASGTQSHDADMRKDPATVSSRTISRETSFLFLSGPVVSRPSILIQPRLSVSRRPSDF